MATLGIGLFCKIIAGEIDVDIVYETDQLLAFRDINPQAPTHVLIIPRRHVATINDIEAGDAQHEVGPLFTAAALATLGFAADILGDATAANPLGFGALAAGIALALSVFAGVVAAWPVRFAAVGAEPDKWWNDRVTQRPLADCLRKESHNYQQRIAHNKSVHATATCWLRVAIAMGSASPILGLLVWAVAVV